MLIDLPSRGCRQLQTASRRRIVDDHARGRARRRAAIYGVAACLMAFARAAGARRECRLSFQPPLRFIARIYEVDSKASLQVFKISSASFPAMPQRAASQAVGGGGASVPPR